MYPSLRQLTAVIAATLLLLISLGSPLLAANDTQLPGPLAVPGGVAHVLLPIDSATPPTAYFGNHRLWVQSTLGTRYQAQAPWLALVGIPLETPVGAQQIDVGKQAFAFVVAAKQYAEQRLIIKDRRKVNPNPLDMERINSEKTRMLSALAHWSEPELMISRFQRPAPGPFSSPFGLRRFFNDQPRKPHSGLDIAAAKGTPILAPAPGVILDAGDYFFNGRNLILDHGRGLISMYSHLERIDVQIGERISTGDMLGTVGNSGRVTGPHLHWTISLNNARVDPLLFLDPAQP